MKLPFGLTYREFDAQRDKHGVFFLWLFGFFSLAVGLTILVIGAANNFDKEALLIGAGIILGSFHLLRLACQTRQKIKEHTAGLTE